MNARRWIILSCLGALLATALPPAMAQKSPALPDVRLNAPQPKDNFTRAKLHTELGSLYFQNNNIIIALEELTIALSIDPTYAPAYSTRGLALYYIQEMESAEKDLKKAISLDAKNPDHNNNYGWFLCQTDRGKEAIPYLQQAAKNPLYQTPEVALLNLGTCYTKLGELALAEQNVRQSLRLSPGNPQAFLQLAKINYQNGHNDAAIQYLDDVVRLTDPNAEALWRSLRIERRLGNTAVINSLAAQLRRKFPDSPEVQALLKGEFE